jgi:hypothetical protein
MRDKIVKCTSKYCPYKRTCYRNTDEEPPSVHEESYNYEYMCSENDGFSYFISKANTT